MCVNCGKCKKDEYGTQEIFRDYVCIEQYPQRWIFTKKEEEESTTTTKEDIQMWQQKRRRTTYLEFDLEEE